MLVAQKDGQISCLGSGVIIGDKVAMTARHVVEAVCEYHEGSAITELRGKVGFSLQAIHFVTNGTKQLAWDVRQIYLHADPSFADIVLLGLEATTEEQQAYKWNTLLMQLLPPRVGSTISAFGYHTNKIQTTGEM